MVGPTVAAKGSGRATSSGAGGGRPSNGARDPRRNRALREAKGGAQEEQQGEQFRDRYQFLLDRLRGDIRFFFHAMQEFVELPEDLAQRKTWEDCIEDMERDTKEICATGVAEDSENLSVEAIVELLNFRDRVLTALVNGLLFQKAVMDFELKIKDPNAEVPMKEMGEMVKAMSSKSELMPEKYTLAALPAAREPGPFSYDKKSAGMKGTATEPSKMQLRMLTLLKEAQNLDKGLRHCKFGNMVAIPDKHHTRGKTIGTDQIRGEITKWFDRCSRLEHELQTNKAQRHQGVEMMLEQLERASSDRDAQNKMHRDKVHKLEGDLQNLKVELSNIRREKAELTEKEQKMNEENLPVLDQIDVNLGKSREAVDRLTADAEMLSSMFRLQVEENRKTIEEREEIARELTKVHRTLKGEKLKSQFKGDELQKKETLYQRTLDARKLTHESYLEQKAKIKEVEERMREREAEHQARLAEVGDRDAEIKRLHEELQEAHREIDELEQQKKYCMAQFKTHTGKPYSTLLEQFKAKPVAESNPGSAT